MKYQKIFLSVLLGIFFSLLLNAVEYTAKKAKDGNHYSYEYVVNDPYNGRIYTLKNGLKVYLARIPVKPRIVVRFLVKAGLADSPADATGLAHYLEHLMFKGTDKIGALDYKKEKVLLDKIEQLYEVRRKEKDPAKKKEIFREIDRLSLQASKYASAGEYSKLVGALGGMELNAFTSQDITAYVVDIPSNELNRFLFLESERLRNPVIRLFHTELEAVYQEFNHGQDNDGRKLYEAILANFFPTHPYGWTPIIGKAVHLKEPSIRLVKKFMKEYYVPGNMALALTGDLQYDETIRMVDRYFSFMKKGNAPGRKILPEKPLTKNIATEVKGSGPQSVAIAFRVKKGKRNELLGTLLAKVLSNGSSGIFDTELVRAQKVLSASASFSAMRDHSFLVLQARPVAGDTLEATAAILLEKLNKVKNGKFADDLLPAVIANYRKSFEEGRNDPESAAWTFLDSFVSGTEYVDTLREIGEAAKIGKKEVASFASNLGKHVTIYKRTGKDDKRILMEKPPITKVALNSEKISAFGKKVLSMPAGKDLKVEKIDFTKDISFNDSSYAGNTYKLFVSHKKAPANDKLFSLNMIRKVGSHHDILLPVAIGYLNYLGTDKFSPDALRKAFYMDATSFSLYCGEDECGIALNGFADKLVPALDLVKHFVENVKADKHSYRQYAVRLITARREAKKNPQNVFRALNMYAAYGAGKERNPFIYANSLSDKELMSLDPEKLLLLAKKYLGFTQGGERVFSYVGPHTVKELDKTVFERLYNKTVPQKKLFLPVKKNFVLSPPSEPHVYLSAFDSVQLLFGIRSRMGKFDAEKLPYIQLFNQYFGAGGLDSIVFQEIREARGLAYSAYAFYITAKDKNKHDAFATYSGLQKDKFFEAADAFFALLRKMPKNENAFRTAKENVIKELLSQRFYGDLYSFYESSRKRGLTEDIRPEILEKIRKITLEDLEKFFKEEIAKGSFDIYISGKISDLDRKKLSKYGKVILLNDVQTFGY